jgi:hypothetical protein
MLREQTRIFSINADYAPRKNNDSFLSDVGFDIPQMLSPIPGAVAVFVSLESATIPSSWFNLDAPYNVIKIRTWGNNGTHNLTLTIEPGSYSAYSLCRAINEQIDLVAEGVGGEFGVEFVYLTSQNKIAIKLTDGNDAVQMQQGTTMGKIIGFVWPDDGLVQDRITQTTYIKFSGWCDLSGVNSYLIRIPQFQLQNWSQVLHSDVIAEIQNDAPTWGLTLWQNNSQLRYSVSIGQAIDQLDVEIYDEKGNFINFRSSPWLLTIKVTYMINHQESSPLHHLIAKSYHSRRGEEMQSSQPDDELVSLL